MSALARNKLRNQAQEWSGTVGTLVVLTLLTVVVVISL